MILDLLFAVIFALYLALTMLVFRHATRILKEVRYVEQLHLKVRVAWLDYSSRHNDPERLCFDLQKAILQFWEEKR